MNHERLIRAARIAKRKSYSPYSKFRVGSALLTAAGKVFTGCNVENSSYSLTLCAERTALVKAVSEGHRKFKAIAIVADGKEFVPPCGACRQVLMELAENIDVILTNSRHEVKVFKLNMFLPLPFKKSILRQR